MQPITAPPASALPASRRTSRLGAARVDLSPAYVLHTTPYRETSLLVDVMTAQHGRLRLVARGARRPKSAYRGVVQAFQPLLISWFGRAELRTLHAAEWQGGLPQLSGLGLMCGFYLNELLLRLVPPEDAMPELFADYHQMLRVLSLGLTDKESALRRFELQVLQHLGYGLDLGVSFSSSSGQDFWCQYQHQQPWHLIAAEAVADSPTPCVLHSTLMQLGQQEPLLPLAKQQAKHLMRYVLNLYLGDQPLNTRNLLRELQPYELMPVVSHGAIDTPIFDSSTLIEE